MDFSIVTPCRPESHRLWVAILNKGTLPKKKEATAVALRYSVGSSLFTRRRL